MKFFAFTLIAVGSALALGACGSDDEEEHSEHVVPAECKPITEACHGVDHGTAGELHECHEGSHSEWTADECTANAANCIALCEAAASDGGGGTAGHAGAGGADNHDQ